MDRLLEVYLDGVITAEEYQTKKNKLVQQKTELSQKIKEIKSKGSTWLEPFQAFVNSALPAHKIARAKNTAHDLKIMSKTVGSNFFLRDKVVNVEFKSVCWQPRLRVRNQIIHICWRFTAVAEPILNN